MKNFKRNIIETVAFSFILLIILFRTYLITFTSQFAGDEAIFALRAVQFLHCVPSPEKMISNTPHGPIVIEEIQKCGKLPIYGMPGHLGIPYGPLPNYLLIFLYWIFNFNIGFILFTANIVSIGSAFLLYLALKNYKEEIVESDKNYRKWVLLLALTSPLAIIFSLRSLWDTPWLIPLSSLLLFLSQKRNLIGIKELILGILLGVTIASHIQVIPFVIGFTIWYLVSYKPPIVKSFLFLFGIFVSSVHYLLRLMLDGRIFSFHPKIAGQENTYADIISLFIGIFRYIGIHPQEIINKTQPLLNLEISISKITTWLLVILVCFAFYFFYKQRHKLNKLPSIIKLFALLYLIYLPIYWFTNAASQPQYGMMSWWIAPVVVPYIILGIFSKKVATIILLLLVSFNTFSLFVQYKERILHRTSISFPLGPSWKEQSRIGKQICLLADANNIDRNNRVIVGISPTITDGGVLPLTLSSIIAMENPNCTSKIAFIEGVDADLIVSLNSNNYNLQVQKQERP